MASVARRKTSLSLDADALDSAKQLGINVSSVADAALKHAVAQARRKAWLAENAEAFTAQSNWHARHGHPLSDILMGPAKDTWKS